VRRHRDPVVKEISNALHYLTPWPPGASIQLGDVGFFPSGAVFVLETQLSALGVDLDAERSTAPQLDYRSGGVTAEPATDRDVTRIHFPEPNSTFFLATNCRIRRIADASKLAAQLTDLQHRGDWNEDWSVVTDVVEADDLVLLVSAEADGFVELKNGADATVEGGTAITRPTVSAQAGMRLSFVSGGPDVVALYRVGRIRRSLWNPASPKLTVAYSYDDL
jgi:hypothetical protein